MPPFLLQNDYSFLFLNEASKEEPAVTAKTQYPAKFYTVLNTPEIVSWYRSILSKGFNLAFNQNLYPNNVHSNEAVGGYDFKRPVEPGYMKAPIYLTTGNLVGIVTKDKRFVITTNLADPRLVTIIRSTIEALPELKDFTISNLHFDDENGEWYYEDHGVASQMLAKTKTIKKKSANYLEDAYEAFKYEVFKDLKDYDWYHATRKSNWPSIKQKGLLPSKTFEQGSGWTQFNFNLQNAVYLTRIPGFAFRIAQTLANRFDEDAIVIKVDGNALKDYTKISVDEDALRNTYDGSVDLFVSTYEIHHKDPRHLHRLPEFQESVSDPHLSSLGYRSIIEPKYLSIVETAHSEVEHDEEEDNNNQ